MREEGPGKKGARKLNLQLKRGAYIHTLIYLVSFPCSRTAILDLDLDLQILAAYLIDQTFCYPSTYSVLFIHTLFLSLPFPSLSY
jgi:hypothetical protein